MSHKMKLAFTSALALMTAACGPDVSPEEAVCIVPDDQGGFPSGIKHYPEIIKAGEIFNKERQGYPAIYDVKTGETLVVGLDTVAQMEAGKGDTSALFRESNQYTGKTEFRSQKGMRFSITGSECKIGGPEGISYQLVR